MMMQNFSLELNSFFFLEKIILITWMNYLLKISNYIFLNDIPTNFR